MIQRRCLLFLWFSSILEYLHSFRKCSLWISLTLLRSFFMFRDSSPRWSFYALIFKFWCKLLILQWRLF
jgi:hypothetical protein